MKSLLGELKRRNVFKVGVAYAVVAWVIAQVLDVASSNFAVPEWFTKIVLIMLVLGLPVALLLSWAYEVTPEGVKKTAEVDKAKSITPKTGAKINKVIAVGLALALAFIVYDKWLAPGAGPGVREAEAGQASIAVLPFADLSPKGDQGYFADGISEEILNVLAQIPSLKVAGRTSSFTFKGKNEDLREIAEQLGVKYVLEGSVRKDNDRVRITTQLISAADGFHLWSKTYDRELTDIFTVQDEISKAVADALEIQLGIGDQPAIHKITVNPESYSIYLRARQALHERTGEALGQARSLFETAVILAPDFSEGWSALARTYSLLPFYQFGEDDPFKLMGKGKSAAKKALALNPGNAEAYSALANLSIRLMEWDDAALANAKAEALAPNDAEIANFIGDFYRNTGDLPNAIKWEQHAFDLDPLHEVNARDLATAYLIAGDNESALKYALVAEKLAPDSVYPMQIKAFALANGRRFKDADALLEAGRAKREQNPFIFLQTEAFVAIREGKRKEALGFLEKMGEMAEQGTGYAGILYIYYMYLGETEQGVKWFAWGNEHTNYVIIGQDLFLPEDYTSDPAILARFDVPGMKELFDLRRTNRAKNQANRQ
jgi:TolB-like protein/tetratricopeptide (TPR) repeat protein